MLVRSRHNLPLRRLATVGTSILNRAPSAASLRPWRQRTRSGRHVAFERNLATALDNLRTGEEIGYDGFVGSIPSGFSTPSHGFYELQGFDGFSPLQLSEPLPPVATKRSTASGMPGRLEETIALYDACIKVGRLDRAAMVLKRIATFNVLSARDMMELHNRYLREKLAHMQAEPGRSKADDLHKWFELEIRGELLPMVPETIAYMLKASFLTAKDKRLETLVKRYMGMLPDDAGLGELHLGDILSDQELSTITQICPVYSLAYESPSYATFEDYPQDGEMDIPLEAAELAMEAEPSETPDVLSTPQKGMGLKAIKRSLSLFDNIKDGNVIANLSPSEQREIQSRLERDCIDSAMERWREENQALQSMGLNTATSNAKLSPKLHEWHTALQARIEEEFKLIDQSMSATKKTAEDLSRCLYGPFILQSTPKRLAAVTILSMLSSIGSEKGVAVSTSVQHIAKVVEEDIRVQRKEKQRAAQRAKARKAKLLRKAQAAQNLAQTGSLNAQAPSVLAERQVAPAAPGAPIADRLQVEDRYDIKDLETNGYWPSTIRVKVGAVLLSAMCESARITAVKENPETGALISQSQPAFVHGCKLKKGKKVGMIMANPVVENLVRQEPRGDFLARHLPMVVEPESWSKWDKGGYIESSTPLVRVKFGEAEQRIYTQAALHRGDMKQMLKGMDVLGKTGWKINRPVFNVMLEVWNSGKEFGSIPPLEPDVKYPPEPETHDDPSLRSLWVRAMKAADNEKCSLHSIRCNMNFQMEVAKAFRDQTFYFPHNVDFRGRAYPIPTYLNHMGADNVRGLLRFAKGKPLGEKGLRWLKVHMANVYGFDKASLDQREQFAMEHLDDIYDSAMNPLSGRMWWKEAEDPWQCLAACYELKAALDSADPTKFVSHLPIHQDGTCNGLQHYAALGGDTWGAKQVNLEPGDRPADVYSAVAQLVQESIAKDAAAGQEFALAVDGKIKRKVVKQTVMTNVYGVTFAGARKQILKQLDALYPNLRSETGQDPNVLASYIARKVFGALSTMFGGAHDIQKWLGAIGGRVCRAVTPEQIRTIAQESSVLSTPKAKRNWSGKPTLSTELLSQFRSTLVWTTPLRMPVVQPYRTSSAQTVATCIQDLVLTQSDRSDPVNQRKQLQAFPPNFIHSLDASHMILSALGCDARGLSFAAVHDSFWTHASDVDTMNEVLRDAFIRIHSDDVIGRLAEEFKMRYKGSMYLAKIPASSKMGKQILQLRKSYTTPITMKDELVMEHQRRLLLESDDAESKIKGEAMTTPSSIYEELQSEGDTELALRADDAMTFAEASEAEETADSTQDPGAAAQMPAVDVVADEAPPSAEGETAFSSTLKRMSDGNYFGHAIKGMRTKAPAQTKERDSVQVWLPLTFPAIPPKGDFDVKRLRQSQYFFS